jgi:hypothetical protein
VKGEGNLNMESVVEKTISMFDFNDDCVGVGSSRSINISMGIQHPYDMWVEELNIGMGIQPPYDMWVEELID